MRGLAVGGGAAALFPVVILTVSVVPGLGIASLAAFLWMAALFALMIVHGRNFTLIRRIIAAFFLMILLLAAVGSLAAVIPGSKTLQRR